MFIANLKLVFNKNKESDKIKCLTVFLGYNESKNLYAKSRFSGVAWTILS